MFNDARLLDCVAYGSQFGHEFNTRIVTLNSGHERRNSDWEMPRFRYSVLYQNLTEADHNKVYFAHMACRGAAIPFRFKDWRDYQAVGQQLGVATGENQILQLFKTYAFGDLEFTRTITKPVDGAVMVFADGVQITADVDYLTGKIAFIADDGAQISAHFEFDVPVRFVSDRLTSDPVARNAASGLRLTSDVDLIEVKGE